MTDPNLPMDPRVRLAAERTLLAWVRTGLALMGFGFVVARFGLFLRELAALGHAAPPGGWSHGIGVAFVVLGVVMNVLAAFEHVQLLKRLARGDPDPFPRWSLGVATTVVWAVFGVGMVVYLLAA